MRPVFWSRDALDDLKAIVSYIARDQGKRALCVSDRIETAGNELGTFATGHAGRVAGTYEKTVTGLPYILAYAIDRPTDKTERIVILHVIHGARDWPEGAWPQ